MTRPKRNTRVWFTGIVSRWRQPRTKSSLLCRCCRCPLSPSFTAHLTHCQLLSRQRHCHCPLLSSAVAAVQRVSVQRQSHQLFQSLSPFAATTTSCPHSSHRVNYRASTDLCAVQSARRFASSPNHDHLLVHTVPSSSPLIVASNFPLCCELTRRVRPPPALPSLSPARSPTPSFHLSPLRPPPS